MANLSNINNKFIVTDGNNGRVLIGATNDIGATLFANHPSTTAPSLTFNAPAGQVFENEDLQIAFGLNNASPYNGYMQTRFVSAPYYRNLAINPLGGNVGIGTNSPGEKLDVDGNIRVRGVSATKQGVIHNSGSYFSLVSTGDTSDTTGARIWLGNNSSANAYYQNASTHYFRDLSSSIKMTLLSSGNLGIGRTPDVKILDLQSTSGLALRFYNSATFKAGIEAVTTAGQMIGSSAVNDLAIRSQSDMLFSTGGNTERMRINSSGEVLVGVTSNQTQSKLTSRQNGSTIEFGHLNQSGQYYGTLGAMSSSGSPFIAFSADNSNSNSFTTRGAKGFVISQDTGISGDLIFSSVPLVNTANQSLVERMRIASNGAIGIGGTNYGAAGEVLTSNGNAAPSWQAAGGSSPWTTSGNDIYNNNSGNVGIGVTSPGAKLEIDGDVIYKNVNQYQTTIARTIEFTCYLQGSNTYTLIRFTQPSTNAQVMATIEYGGIITGNNSDRFAGSNSSITKYNGYSWYKSFVELGYVGNTSYRPQFYWDFGRLMINVKNSTDNLFRIRLTYRGFGAAPTKTYPN